MFIFDGELYQPIPYNFILEPYSKAPGRNKVLLCEHESLEFLAKNGMDFSKIFLKGIPSNRFKTPIEEKKH